MPSADAADLRHRTKGSSVDGMSRTGQTRHAAAAVRLLGLLAVVLGLLAMHGLASAHHAAAAPPVHAPPVHAPSAAADHSLLLPQDLAGTHRHDHGAPGSPAAAGTATAAGLLDVAGAGPAVPGCGDDCPSGLAVLCAAVIAAAAATAWLVAATARRRVLAAPARGGPRPRAPDAARRLLPGPDPVAELCVSRT